MRLYLPGAIMAVKMLFTLRDWSDALVRMLMIGLRILDSPEWLVNHGTHVHSILITMSAHIAFYNAIISI
jgi:hypothetical protein